VKIQIIYFLFACNASYLGLLLRRYPAFAVKARIALATANHIGYSA
jgi:hypothetical protein